MPWIPIDFHKLKLQLILFPAGLRAVADLQLLCLHMY